MDARPIPDLLPRDIRRPAMDDGETAPPPAKRKKAPYMPHELVSEILARLPVESLLRFSVVCKAWRATISRDASFHRAHLRLQKPCLLVSPHTEDESYRLADDDEAPLPTDKVGLYRWEPHQPGTTAPLVHATDLSSDDLMHDFPHCDGLVLLPGEAAVHVLNPATRRTLMLPRSPGTFRWPCRVPYTFAASHQAFGLGHDPRSNMYKVARFFYRSVYPRVTGGYHYGAGMEVFTIGADEHWRETATHPPYPVLAQRTATFFKGSLIWTIDERSLQGAAPGFLRFGLEDEDFEVMPPPPCQPRLEYTMSNLSELRGELCLACVGADEKSIEMWMCDNVENPQWDRRYTIIDAAFSPRSLYPVAVFDGEILFKDWMCNTRRYDLRTKAFKDVHMWDLRYHDPSTGTFAYRRRTFTHFDVIHYVPSLIPV